MKIFNSNADQLVITKDVRLVDCVINTIIIPSSVESSIRVLLVNCIVGNFYINFSEVELTLSNTKVNYIANGGSLILSSGLGSEIDILEHRGKLFRDLTTKPIINSFMSDTYPEVDIFRYKTYCIKENYESSYRRLPVVGNYICYSITSCDNRIHLLELESSDIPQRVEKLPEDNIISSYKIKNIYDVIFREESVKIFEGLDLHKVYQSESESTPKLKLEVGKTYMGPNRMVFLSPEEALFTKDIFISKKDRNNLIETIQSIREV